MSLTKGVGSMTDKEVNHLIQQHACGVLTVIDGDKPYSVVMEYYYSGKNFYFLTQTKEEQRKLKCLRDNPKATLMMYESRRENPDMVKQGIKCRSVLVEGVICEKGLIESKQFPGVFIKMLKLEPAIISNWMCQREKCDWNQRWYDRRPDLVVDLE